MREDFMLLACPVCSAWNTRLHTTVDGFNFYDCNECQSISIEPRILEEIDAGTFVRSYDNDYWQNELASAKGRSWGAALARVAEVLLYAKQPVVSFIDIGTGPGFLLEALDVYLPESRGVFWGVEAYPPPQHSIHPNYWVGRLGEMDRKFQAGCCIEVLEHLTPKMAQSLAFEMASRSDPGAVYIFNTGLPEFVKKEDPSYLDPVRRGHIVSYGLKGVRHLFEPAGFSVIPLPGKVWAFLLEYADPDPKPIIDRIWYAHEWNKAILNDQKMGTVMYVLGIESARAYNSG